MPDSTNDEAGKKTQEIYRPHLERLDFWNRRQPPAGGETIGFRKCLVPLPLIQPVEKRITATEVDERHGDPAETAWRAEPS